MSAMTEAGNSSSKYLASCVKSQENGVEGRRIDASFFPAGVIVVGHGLAGHEAPIEIDGAAARAHQVLYRSSESGRETEPPGVVPESIRQLIPVSPVDTGRQESVSLERRDQLPTDIVVYMGLSR